jgi:hypothetical protein
MNERNVVTINCSALTRATIGEEADRLGVHKYRIADWAIQHWKANGSPTSPPATGRPSRGDNSTVPAIHSAGTA